MRQTFFTGLAHFTKIVLAIFIFAIAFTPTQSYAAAEGGEYSCRWDAGNNTCAVALDAMFCEPSYESNDEICNSMQTSTACNNAINLACESVGCPSGRYAVGAATCQCVGADYSGVTYPSMDACNNRDIDTGDDTCGTPTVRMCNYGNGCRCVTPNSCGGFKQEGCFSLDITSGLSRFCQEGLTPMQPTEGTGNTHWYCVHTQEDADAAASGIALTERPAFNLCLQSDAPTECYTCATRGGVWTAIGCVPTTRKDIVGLILTLALSISGGIVLLRILQAGFMLSTSQGEQNKVQEARDILTSSIAGLLFIIFSMVLLNTIGVSILQIPGF